MDDASASKITENLLFIDRVLWAIHTKAPEEDRWPAAADFQARSKVISGEAALRLVSRLRHTLSLLRSFTLRIVSWALKATTDSNGSSALILDLCRPALPPDKLLIFHFFYLVSKGEMKCEPCNHLLDGLNVYKKIPYPVRPAVFRCTVYVCLHCVETAV